MKMTKRGRLYQLAFMPRMFPVNCYLIEEENGLTLIDTAMPYSSKAILRAAAQIGKPIRRLILTHSHADHIGALEKLVTALPEAQICISRREARLLAGDRSLDPGEPGTSIRGGVPKPGKISIVPDVLLEDGDRIGSLLAVAVPGHTPGSMAFLDTRSGALVAGDAMQTQGGMAVSGFLKLTFPFPAMATWNKSAALDSARKLLELKPSLLAAGHGPMAENPAAAMDRAIKEAVRKLNRGT